uniref:Uncharacterized protein n=1 Tax=Aegilops tauschii TaxID=37682 RepID=R7W8P3_AEGTA
MPPGIPPTGVLAGHIDLLTRAHLDLPEEVKDHLFRDLLGSQMYKDQNVVSEKFKNV